MAKNKSENSKRQVPRTGTRNNHVIINDVITEQEVLNNLQKGNGIKTLTGYVDGMSLEIIPEENTKEKTSNVARCKPEVQGTRL